MTKHTFPKEALLYLPLLLIYIIIVLVFSSDILMGDESRHFNYALNLTNGYYVEAENPNFRNGPGYPLVLAPFIAVGCSLLTLKFLNIAFVAMAVFYFKKTIDLFAEGKFALIAVYMIGLYPPVLRWLPFLYSEPMAYFLMCGLIFYVCQIYRQKVIRLKQLCTASIFLGLLILTKIIYLQVIMVSALCLILLLLWKKNRTPIRALLILAGSFLILLPYLVYAYTITGKLFYVGSGGGEILYHRSTPYPNEWGNWFSKEDVLFGGDTDYTPTTPYKNLNELSKNHKEFYLTLEPLSYIERDSVFKAAAIANMKAHPKKYLKNTVASLSRLVFHFPFSYRNQSLNAYGYMIPNVLILFLWVLSIYPFLRNRKKSCFEINALLLFSLIYTGGIVLLDGRGRNFITVVPALVLFFTFVYSNFLNIKLTALRENSTKQSLSDLH
ncbi:hypothetical protein FGM00_16610 [Aggregatimonas sangjinii]|uniref:Glycosyltransferase RgtA/B/C/D-like domain-containing protein n=1 Tax=Aggregatimonas sangjinii TaxID=2583587 RepID=A0A5B7SWU0_9FLAO|nr:hypothetical protein [Aggregatimonas sangjinii]QCX01653.1 hypothetical protein FGM00_16610 [Aggregatimonas sangjinii]